MSLLPVVGLVKEYNKDRPSCFEHDTLYTLNDEDNRKLTRIAEMIELIKPPFLTSLQVCKHSGQVYVRCKLPPCMFPLIQGAKKV